MDLPTTPDGAAAPERPWAAPGARQHPLPAHRPQGELRHALLAIAQQAHAEVDGADGAGITVLLGGGPVYAGANPYTDAIDEIQDRLDEGPCLSALASGRVVRSTTIGTTERRWPHFTSEASALSLRSVLSVPVLAAGDVIGSLNVYSRVAQGRGTAGRAALERAASAAGRSLVNARLLALLEGAAHGLGAALQDRADTDLAVGVLMDRYSFSASEALIMVAQLARQNGVTAAEAARELTGLDRSS